MHSFEVPAAKIKREIIPQAQKMKLNYQRGITYPEKLITNIPDILMNLLIELLLR
jgi:hypothetical protein